MSLHAVTLSVVVTAVLAACSGGGWPARLSVERWASPNPGSVNAYWIDGPDGIVIVDVGRNVTGGQKIADAVSRKGRRVAAILLTHPHPDHVGGLGVLHEKFPDTPIYASEATDKWMRDDPLNFYSLARKADPDYPQTLTYPTETFASDAELRIAGLTLQTANFGPGESATATVYFDPSSRALFGGDQTGNHVRPAVALDSDSGTTMTDRETRYLVGELDRAYPNYPRVASLPNLQELNVAAVGRELAAEATATMPPECN
jgi:glyoxylase-like metal-dependent hydrolase (beta-lactamase superfamily II)